MKKLWLPKSLLANHKQPVTRRELISAGLSDSVMLLGLPTILDLVLAKKAEAGPTPPRTLYFIRDSAGGDAATSHFTFIPHTSGGTLPSDAALQNMGLPTSIRSNPSQVTEAYGAPMRVGPYTQKLEALLPAAIRAKVRIGVVLCDTPDDTRTGQQGLVSSALSAYLSNRYPTNFLVQGATTVMPDRADLNIQLDASGVYSTTGLLGAADAEQTLAIYADNAIQLALRAPFGAMTDARSLKIMSTLEKLAKNRQARLQAISEIGLAKDARESYRRYQDNITTGASISIDPSTQLTAATRAILNAQPAAYQAEQRRFQMALTAAAMGISRPLLRLILSGADHHNGSDMFANPASATLLYMDRAFRYDASVITEAAARGMNAVIVRLGDGGMRAGVSGGLPYKVYVSDERRFSQIVVTTYIHDRPLSSMPRSIVGACDMSGYNRSDTEVSSPATAGAIAFANALWAAGETDAETWVARIIPRATLDPKLFSQVRMFG